METNWLIIGIVIVACIVLIAFLIWRNQRDKEKVTQYFKDEASDFHDEESEFNNNK